MASEQINSNRYNQLTTNPQNTFFLGFQQNYLNFSRETLEITSQEGNPMWGKNNTYIIPQKYDLISNLYLRIYIPATAADTVESADRTEYVKAIGHALIKTVTFYMNNNEIDKHTGHSMDVWSRLKGLSRRNLGIAPVGETGSVSPEKYLFVPLQFWFCNDPSMSLPCNRAYIGSSEIKVMVDTRKFYELLYSNVAPTESNVTIPSGATMSLIVTYVSFDNINNEFLNDIRDYYINQYKNIKINTIQYLSPTSLPGTSTSLTINISNTIEGAIKEIMWFAQENITNTDRDYFRYNDVDSDTYTDKITNVTLKLNGVTIISQRSEYFSEVLPSISASIVPVLDEEYKEIFIHIYSWALYPNESSISGALNISTDRQLNLELTLQDPTYEYNLFAITVKDLSLHSDGTVEIRHIRYTQPKE